MAFLSQKVTYGAVCAKLGVRNSPLRNEQGEPMVKNGKLSLGNLDSARDWGYAGDYVQAMWLMLQQPQADDFVIGTGVSRSVREMCEAAYTSVGLDWREHVATDPGLVRPAETGLPSPTPARPNGCSAGSPPPALGTCWPTWWRRIWSGFNGAEQKLVTLPPILLDWAPEVRMVPFFVQIKCQLGKSYEVANRLADAEIASEIYSTAGEFDLLIKVYVDNGTDIGHFVNEKVQTVPGIQDTRTIITFKAF